MLLNTSLVTSIEFMDQLEDRKPSPPSVSSTGNDLCESRLSNQDQVRLQRLSSASHPSSSDKNNEGDQNLPAGKQAPAEESSFTARSCANSSGLDEIWNQDLSKVDLQKYVKAHCTTIAFPEKLMMMLIHIERIFAKSGKKQTEAPISWTLAGRAFIIRDSQVLVKNWLPMFFRQGKFQSFTRKLYRWGFRQVNVPRDTSQDSRELVFANSHFQRDNRSLMAQMKSITAAGLRREHELKKNETKESEKLAMTSLSSSNVESLMAQQPFALAQGPRHISLPSLSSIPAPTSYLEVQSTLNPLLHQLLLSQRPQAPLSTLEQLIRQSQAQSQHPWMRSTTLSAAPSPFSLPLNLEASPFAAAADPFQALSPSSTRALIQAGVPIRSINSNIIMNNDNSSNTINHSSNTNDSNVVLLECLREAARQRLYGGWPPQG